METKFTKYSCQGNDFILFDYMNKQDFKSTDFTPELVAQLCERKLGIGADGILILAADKKYDFQMIYFNADGIEVEMCGNGSRALVAHYLEQHSQKAEVEFRTMNGIYKGMKEESPAARVKVQMTELGSIQQELLNDYQKLFEAKKSFYLEVGVPHAIFEVENLDDILLEKWGRMVRYDSRFKSGTNVNFFVVNKPGELAMRTYERGVEAETLACGTGATAVAEVYRAHYENKPIVQISLSGGDVWIEKKETGETYLCAPVAKVFEGLYFPSGLGLK